MNPWDWLRDLWSWAIDNGTIGALLIATVATVVAVLVAATALIWTVAGLKAAGQALARGYREGSGHRD